MLDSPYSLLAELESVAAFDRPPVHLWQPDTVKDIDLTIRRDGSWHYLGTPIRRPRLTRLFSSVMRREDDGYFLVTPVEKCRITVEDVPFQIIQMEARGEGERQDLVCTTDMAETFTIGAGHALRIVVRGEEWIPYAHVRDRLDARMARSVYYRLAELVVEKGGDLGVWSGGEFHPMMPAAGHILP